jgi:hypothetical protein
LYTAAELPAIRARLDREPYKTWRNMLTAEAEAILSREVDWSGTEEGKPVVRKPLQAYYAKTLAGAYVFSASDSLNRRRYAEEAAKALRFVPAAGFKGPFTSDLEISEAAAYWAAAYDMLKGEGFDFAVEGYPDMEAVIRSNLSALRGYMATYMASGAIPTPGAIGRDFPSAALYTIANSDNHHVKLLASLILLSLSVYDTPGASDAFPNALSRFIQTLNNITISGKNEEPYGGWAEGPQYHLYTMREYLPALTALQNHTLFSYSSNPEITETHLILPRTIMPDGFTPPFDDNEAIIFDMAPLLASRHRDRPECDALLWLWERNGRPANKAFLPDLIAQFDDTPPAHIGPGAMGWPLTDFRPDVGYARFRNSWEKDAIYFLFQTERDEAREKGQAHEHPDPNSFILHAFGEMLIMDSGYGGFDKHDATRQAINHNIILVNGQGPAGASQQFGSIGFWRANGADATLDKYFTTPGLDFARSRTRYLISDATDFTRNVLFADHRYFILFDQVTNAFEPKTYTLLLHGNGGGTSGGAFTLLPDGARWDREKAGVRAFCLGTNDLTLSFSFETQDLSHAVYERSPLQTHTTLKFSQKGVGAQFLTLLYPHPAGLSMPDIAQIPVSPEFGGAGFRLALGDTVDICTIKQRGDTLSFSEKGMAFTADADLAWCRILPDGMPGACFILNGTSFSGFGGMMASLSAKGNLSVDLHDPRHITGYIQTGAANTITLLGGQPSRVTFRG